MHTQAPKQIVDPLRFPENKSNHCDSGIFQQASCCKPRGYSKDDDRVWIRFLWPTILQALLNHIEWLRNPEPPKGWSKPYNQVGQDVFHPQ